MQCTQCPDPIESVQVDSVAGMCMRVVHVGVLKKHLAHSNRMSRLSSYTWAMGQSKWDCSLAAFIEITGLCSRYESVVGGAAGDGGATP